MLNFNNVPEDANPQNQEFSLIPVGTIARAVLLVQQGDVEVPEFGQGQWFKKSASTAAKWMNLEFTIIGGEFDRRKFWHSVFIDGDKIGPSGMPLAKEIGLRTLKSIVESARNIDPADMSPQAQQNRNIGGMMDLNAMELCVKVGIKKGTNGYKDNNQLMAALTPNNSEFLPKGNIPMQATPAAGQQPTAPQPSGAVPSWAQQ
jgi:hypothetical protein|tara:strand:+ start:1018 stop:1626 length:609 start_codon:yes stop_codon:yes gene_type:complete